MLRDDTAEEGAATTPHITTYKPGARTPLSKRAFWCLLLSIEISMLGIAIDVFSIPVAVPSLSADILGYLNSAWLGTAFLASFGLGFLIWPRLCKGFTYKFSFAVAMVAFYLAGSYSPTYGTKTAGRLITLRAVAGAGAGGAYGLFEMVLRDIVPPKDFNKYMSVSRMIWAAAAAGGPLASGALVDSNLGPLSYELGPFLGCIGYLMALAFLNLPEPSWTDTWLNFSHFDYLGSLFLTASTFCMLLVSASGGTIFPWVSGHPVGLSIAGLALLGGFCFVEPLVPDPLLHPSLLLDPGLVITAIVAFFCGANLYGTMCYVPQFFQLVLEDSAFMSSVGTLPMMLSIAFGTAGATFITSRHQISVDSLARGGAALMALMSGLMVRWSTNTSRGEIFVVLSLLGLGQGAACIAPLRTVKTSVARSPAGSGAKIAMFFQALGSAFGVACFAALYMSRLQSSLGALVPDVAQTLADMGNAEDEYVAGMKPHVRDAYESSMPAGWWLMFACALVVLALSFLTRRSSARDDRDLSILDDSEKESEAEKAF